jgi:hypothetical protein
MCTWLCFLWSLLGDLGCPIRCDMIITYPWVLQPLSSDWSEGLCLYRLDIPNIWKTVRLGWIGDCGIPNSFDVVEWRIVALAFQAAKRSLALMTDPFHPSAIIEIDH